MSKILTPMLVSLAGMISILATPLSAATISNNCEGYNDISLMPTPIGSETLSIGSKDDFPLDILLAQSFVGEPVSAGSWLVLIVTQWPESTCYLIANDPVEGGEQTGFNDTLVSKAIYRVHKDEKKVEIFIPITDYPFLDEENHNARLIEINIDDQGKVTLIN